ncbi:MAG: tyrosinase family protein, partial [Isosphaeraceae bacterium]
MSRVVEAGVIAIALWGSLAPAALAFQDVYIKDTPADTGVEPNPDSGPMWVSEDVWVRRTPDPGYRPFPFPEASPPWVPAPHQNPEYRDPKYSVPNFVYVRVRNRGTRASTGTEQLQLYWAKASSGLAWPASWVDSFAPVCGTNRLLGAEITKPRKNAATASPAERQALRDALIQAATNPAFTFLAGHSYWTKQQHVHRFSPEHSNPAFLPWHREFLNRFEILVQEADPRVKLMYWNWTTDPAPAVGTNLYTAAFMGNSGRGTGGTGMGAPLAPALNPHPSDTAAAVVRDLSPGAPPAQADATVLGRTDYISAVP